MMSKYILSRPLFTLMKNESILLNSIRYKTTSPFNSSRGTDQTTTSKKQDWKPIKRVSRTTMDKIRTLNKMKPDVYNAVTLATEFKLSTEAVKRILKSKFQPSMTIAERQEKNRYAAMGLRRLAFKESNKKT
ncbi:unnamed protein product [Cunninghamella blakesleeana]